MREMLRSLLRSGGVLRLYRGYEARVILVATNGALWNWVYVRTRDVLAPVLNINM